MPGCKKRTIEALTDPKSMINHYLDAMAHLLLMTEQGLTARTESFESYARFTELCSPHIKSWVETSEILPAEDIRYISEKLLACMSIIPKLESLLSANYRNPRNMALQENIKVLRRLIDALQQKFMSSFRASLAPAPPTPAPPAVDPIESWLHGVRMYGNYEDIWKAWTADDCIVNALTSDSLNELLYDISDEEDTAEFYDLAIALNCVIKKTELLTEQGAMNLTRIFSNIRNSLFELRQTENRLIYDLYDFSDCLTEIEGVDEYSDVVIDCSDLITELKKAPADHNDLRRALNDLTASFNELILKLSISDTKHSIIMQFESLSSEVREFANIQISLDDSDYFFFNRVSEQVALFLTREPQHKTTPLGNEAARLLAAQYLYLTTSKKALCRNLDITTVDARTGERVIVNAAKKALIAIQPERSTDSVSTVQFFTHKKAAGAGAGSASTP